MRIVRHATSTWIAGGYILIQLPTIIIKISQKKEHNQFKARCRSCLVRSGVAAAVEPKREACFGVEVVE